MSNPLEPAAVQQYTAGVDLVGRTGASEYEFRVSEPEDGEEGRPNVYVSVAYFGDRYDAGAGPSPLASVQRLLDQLLDGGTCTRCGKAAGVVHDLAEAQLAEVICWYQYDPELNTYRRGCEGDT